jgi:hypothetical protein
MTSGSQPALVGAVFPDRSSAAAAVADLRRSGFDDDELASAEWLEGKYVLASHAGQNIKKSLLRGGVIGTVLGAIVGAILTVVLWQSADAVEAILVGGVAGAAFGATLGSYFGLIRYRPQLWNEEDWSHIEVEDGEVLIVMAEEDRPDLVREILERQGGRRVEPVHPE